MLFLVPFLGWLCSGITKYLINRVRFGVAAKQMVGNGGFPSTHTTVAVSVTSAIGFSSGISSEVFALGIAFTFIVIIDATGIRRALGRQAKSLNELNSVLNKNESVKHRESQGHTFSEILGGIGLGILVGWISSLIF